MGIILDRIALIKKNENPFFVTELQTGYVVFADHQLFSGYTLFLCKRPVNELHMLDKKTQENFMIEMAQVARAVWNVFQPDKLNYELLGNSDGHLHWHIIPRYRKDPAWGAPIWSLPKATRESVGFWKNSLAEKYIERLRAELIMKAESNQQEKFI